MKRRYFFVGVTILMILAAGITVQAENAFEKLKQGEKVNGFTVLNLYDNAADKPMGARFISDRYGLIMDLLQIQSVPQAFFWVKSVPESDKGEPHTCEHVLLGKGNRGRYVASLEGMTLSSSTAYTGQLRTCYHFNTIAGEKTFYTIFEEALKALVQPDFTDEEVRREVCHIGVDSDPKTGQLKLDEKGTVYTEMVSSFEKPWYYSYRVMDEMLYGPNHPLANISGGDPAAIRTQTAEDLNRFHKADYHLGNMGVIVSIPDNIALHPFLKKMDEILGACQSFPDSNAYVGIGKYNLPPPQPTAQPGEIRVVDYPGDIGQDPGYMSFSWPAALEINNREEFLGNLFMEAFAGGATSNLYDYFINSQTRRINLGGNSIYGGISSDLGHPVYFGISGIDNAYVTEKMLDSVRNIIVGEIERVYNFADGSDSLKAFNERTRSRLIQNRKETENYLNTPPMFGFRSGPAGRWVGHLESLEKEPGFRKSLVQKELFSYADSLLGTGNNFWRSLIDQWKVRTIKPYAVGGKPSPDIVQKENEEKAARIAGYIEDFKKKYGVSDEQQALTKYKEEFDRKTAELDSIAAKTPLPHFIDNPPMTLDDQLKYETINLPGNIALGASTFDNMTAATVGMALRIDVIPESLLVYLPLLPSILTDIGVIKDGQVIPYEKMKDLVRNEILDLDARFDIGYQSGRAELILTAAGGNQEELRKALGWMDACLYSPYLSVDNVPRLMDIVDQSLISLRNVMKGSEEYWVTYPALAYRYQTNPLFLSADCFLTKIHHLQRLKWLLTDPGNEIEETEISAIIDSVHVLGKGKSRAELTSFLAALANPETDSATQTSLTAMILSASERTKTNAVAVARSLQMTLPEIPDADLAGDWDYLCREIKTDIMIKPERTVARMNDILSLLRKTDNARMFMISNSTDRNATFDIIEKLVTKLDATGKSIRQTYSKTDRITGRLRDRVPGLKNPDYVGLVNENTRNGVIISSARDAGIYDTSTSAIINDLAARMYTGGGGHSLFMKTWGAGLAYSNGVSYNERNGRVGYYAERCPDISETMRFVVDQLKTPLNDPSLVDYATAQVFLSSRAASTYESRGQGMANDLADNLPPDMVRNYRRKVMEVRKTADLMSKMKARVEPVLGLALVGYGPKQSESPEASFFIIGPEPQFKAMEEYIKATDGEQPVYRLYPRDFWLTM